MLQLHERFQARGATRKSHGGDRRDKGTTRKPGPDRATEAEACLTRICREGGLPEEKTIAQLRLLLKRADVFHKKDGVDTRQALGRAAAEWPELHLGRRLVELFLIFNELGQRGAAIPPFR